MTSLEFYTNNFEPQDLLDSNSKIYFVFYVYINLQTIMLAARCVQCITCLITEFS